MVEKGKVCLLIQNKKIWESFTAYLTVVGFPNPVTNLRKLQKYYKNLGFEQGYALFGR